MTAATAPAHGVPMQTVLLNLLTPLLSAGGLTEPALARHAAADTLADCRAQGEVQLLSAAQLVGYGVAGLDLLQIGARSAAPPDEQVRLRNAASRLGLMSARAARTLETRQREAGTATAAEFAPHDVAEEAAALADLAATTQRLREVREAPVHQGSDERSGPLLANLERVSPLRQLPDQQRTDRRLLDQLPPHQEPPAQTRAHQATVPNSALKPTAALTNPQPPDQLPLHREPPAQTWAHQATPVLHPAPQPAPFLTERPRTAPPSERIPLTPGEQRAHKLMWAGAMTQVAQESAAHLPALPAAERRLEGIRISALCSVARDLTDAAHMLARIVPASGPPRPG